MVDGVKVLSKIDPSGGWDVLFVLVVVVMAVIAIVGIIRFIDGEGLTGPNFMASIFILFMCFAAGSLMWGVIEDNKESDTKYLVKVDKDVDIYDFDTEYEVVEKVKDKDNTYIIKKKFLDRTGYGWQDPVREREIRERERREVEREKEDSEE